MEVKESIAKKRFCYALQEADKNREDYERMCEKEENNEGFMVCLTDPNLLHKRELYDDDMKNKMEQTSAGASIAWRHGDGHFTCHTSSHGSSYIEQQNSNLKDIREKKQENSKNGGNHMPFWSGRSAFYGTWKIILMLLLLCGACLAAARASDTSDDMPHEE